MKNSSRLTKCKKGHAYIDSKKWCPTCGELNPLRVPESKKLATAMIIHAVPVELRKRFKKACHHEDSSMRAQLLAFMQAYSNVNGFPPPVASPSKPESTPGPGNVPLPY